MNGCKKITLIRHAQSRFNAGQTDALTNCGITDQGAQDASNLNFSFDCLIISPLKRSIQTYTCSKIKTGKIMINELFREHVSWNLNFLDNETPAIETVDDLVKRAYAAFEFLNTIEYYNIGVITHSDFLQTFTERILGTKISLNNCQALEFYINAI